MSLKEIKESIEKNGNVVFFGGAGTSTESGIPDFRSAGEGLYKTEEPLPYPPEQLLSSDMLAHNPDLFFSYYLNNMIHPGAKPNKAHKVLAEWEKEGLVGAVVTQNIDGLHQMAGSRNVLELHGSVHSNTCTSCRASVELETIWANRNKIPLCKQCGGLVRPDVVLYGEALNMDVFRAAAKAISKAGVLIVGGSSLVVHPAAGLIDYYSGEHLLIINRDATPYDSRAKWVIKESIGNTLENLSMM